MTRMSLCFCCSLYFLGIMCIAKAYNDGTGGHQKYSNVVSKEQKVRAMPGAVRPWTDSEFTRIPPVVRPYHVFPMFQNVPAPLVDMELFRPVSERRQLPNRLTSLLTPQLNPQLTKVTPVRNARGVEVWCGYSKVSVRMKSNLLGLRSSPSSFQLGTCPVTRSDKIFLYFHYDLNDCDSSLTVMDNQIMYSNTVHFTPEPQGTVIRAVPLTLNIQCLYNRFHYSYKVGYLPVPRERMFHKIFERRAKFSISVCNERWERLDENGTFVLGEPMYFEVSATHTSKDERIFVDSCYATASKDPKSTPQHNVILNYGCMEDSRRQGSLSRFVQRESKIIRFSIDAFLLPQVTGMHFYMHCTVSFHNAISATAKSCTYNNAERRWDELYTDASVCACCDSTCEIEATSSLPHMSQSLITSLPWILEKNEQSFTATVEGLNCVQEDTEEVKFRSAEGIGEGEEVNDTVEIVTETEKQMEAKEKNKMMPMKDSKETNDIELNDEGDRSGKVMSVGEQVDSVVEFKEDAGRLKNTEGIGKEKEDGYPVEIVSDTENQVAAKEENEKMSVKDFDENVEVNGTAETTDIELNDEGDRSGKVMSFGEPVDSVVQFEEDAGRLKNTEGIGKEKEDGYTVDIVSDTENQVAAKEENEKMSVKDFDENVEVNGTAETTDIELNDEGDRSGKVMSFGEQVDSVVQFEEDAGRLKNTEGIGKEKEDGYNVEIVSDTENQVMAKEENEKMSMNDLDEDVEVFVGTAETTDIELNDEGDRSGKVMSVGEKVDSVVQFEEDAGRLKSTEGIGKEKEDGYTVEIVSDTENQVMAKEENEKMSMNDLDEDVEVIVGTAERTDIELNDEGNRSGNVMSVGEQVDSVVQFKEDAGRLKNTSRTQQSSVPLIEELLEDGTDDKGSSKSGLKELIGITRELSKYKTQPEGFKNMHVQSTVPSHLMMIEEIFLNSKQEPIEWNKDEH